MSSPPMLQPPPPPQIVVFETNATAAGVSVAFVASPDFDGAEGGDALLVLDPTVAAAALRAGASHAEARAAATSSLREYRAARQSPASPRSAARCTGAPAAAFTNVTMQPCASVGPAGQWDLIPAAAASNSSGRWALPGGRLCLGVWGVDAATGTPNLAAVPCAAAGDRSQDFIAFAGVFGGGDSGGALMSVAASAVLDIPASDASAGARVELYSPNGGPNQRWSAAGGAIVSGLSGLCLAAC